MADGDYYKLLGVDPSASAKAWAGEGGWSDETEAFG